MTNNPTTGGSSGGDHLDSAKREALREFTDTCNALVSRIQNVSNQVEEDLATVTSRNNWLMERAKRFRIGFRVLYGLTALVMTTAIILAVVASNMASTQHTLQRSDRVQTNEALCPLYAQFINSDTQQARDTAIKNGQKPEVRDAAFATIRNSYTVLGCMPELGPDGKLPAPPPPPTAGR